MNKKLWFNVGLIDQILKEEDLTEEQLRKYLHQVSLNRMHNINPYIWKRVKLKSLKSELSRKHEIWVCWVWHALWSLRPG